jgi:hypothetical protein
MELRKVVVYLEEITTEGRRTDDEGPLTKVAALAVIRNPYAGRPWSSDLGELIGASRQLAQLLTARACRALNAPVEGYGKGAIVGTAGEQEHANACLTSAFGDVFREGIGGGKAWLPSVTKRGGPGSSLDIPICYKDAIWVRSHYDAITASVIDAPLEDEILVGLAVTNRGRINARLGGLQKNDVKGEDGLR